MRTVSVLRIALLSSISASFLADSGAQAGGLAIREQSTYYQGLSFAGNAAGGALSSMFWNPAATATLPGFNTESSFTLIVPDAQVTVTKTTPNLGPLFPDSSDIANLALVSSSYAAYQLSGYSPNLFIGLGINSPFGNSFEPDKENYKGALLGRTSKLLTVNVNPNVAYRIAPGVIIGAGLQIQYADATLKFAAGLPNAPNAFFRGDDVAVGATAGILLQPTAGTSVGLGWRSRLSHNLDGDFGIAGVAKQSAEGQINLPDIVTLSFSQALAPNMRLLGTVEWSHWSRLKELTVDPVMGPGLAIPLNWSDGWFFSLGGEYDVNRQLTLRTGVAYEISPVDSPEKRTIGIPDSDRIWVSAGASYKWTESTTIDLAYTHIFLDDARFDRVAPASGILVEGKTEASTDIFSVGLRTRWGGAQPLK